MSTRAMSESIVQPALPRTLRIAPELRRCCIYVMAGCVVLAATAHVVASYTAKPVPIAAFVMYGGCMAGMMWPLCLRLEVDAAGVTKRSLLGSARWSWDEFASGRIKRVPGNRFLSLDRTPWNNKLRFGNLAIDDRAFLLDQIYRHYQGPEVAPLPVHLEIKITVRGKLVMNASGLEIQRRQDVRRYRWEDVELVHVRKEDKFTDEFRSLFVGLPDDEIDLRTVVQYGTTSGNFRGASGETIYQFIKTNCPTRAWAESIGRQLPAHVGALKKLEQAALSDVKAFRWMSAIFGIIFLYAICLLAMENVVKAVAMLTLYSMLLLPMLFFGWRRVREQRHRVQEAIARLARTPRASSLGHYP